MPTRQQYKQHASTFFGGMNKDLDYSYMDTSMYLHAENLKLVADEDNSTGALETVKGNVIILSESSIQTASSDDSQAYYLIDYTVNGNKAILFMVANDESYSAIFELEFDGNSLDSYTELYNDSGLSTQLGWDKDTTISAILRRETSTIENLYWLDGSTNIRYFNIIGAPDSLKSGGNFISPQNFSPTPTYPFSSTSIELDSIGNSGSLEAGVVRYAYKFISSSGSESPISNLTGLYHITKSDEYASNSRNYEGTEIDKTCNKSFTLKITVSDSEILSLYDEIIPYSIHYSKLTGEPVINELNSITISTGSTYRFTDSGTGYVSTITLTEFLVESSILTSTSSIISKAQNLESKDNRLFLADVETTTIEGIDLTDYDSRAYRFTSTGASSPRTAVLYDSDNNIEATIDGTGSPIDWETDNITDAINSFNYIPYYGSADGATGYGTANPMDDYEHYKYQSDGTTLGASGPNIDISFTTKEITLDDAQNLKKVSVSEKDSSGYGFKNYASPYYTANFKSYQRDEIYRYSIKFIDNTTGNETSPQWICDLRMPHMIEEPIYSIRAGTSILIGKILSPVFTVNSLPSGATSYQILRTERTTDEKYS